MRFALPALLVLLAPLAVAQDAVQDLRLRAVQNDAVDGGTIQVAIELRTGAERAPNTTLSSGTIDVRYDPDHLTPSGANNIVNDQDGYTATISVIDCDGATCARLNFRAPGVGPGDFGGSTPGIDVSTDFVTVATLSFTLNAVSAQGATFVVNRPSLSAGYFNSRDNSDGRAETESNVANVGDDVVAFRDIQDLTTATLSLADGPNWYMLGTVGQGTTLDDLVAPIFTQGYPGADSEAGELNVAFWDEATAAYVAPSRQSAALAPGVGLFAYAFADDDNDGTPESFPKTSLVTADAVNAEPSPVNNIAGSDFSENPYVADVPFAFPVTYTAGAPGPDGPGWNLLSNPSSGVADWDDAGWTRTNVDAAVYTYETDAPGGAEYQSYVAGIGGTRPDALLAPFEGFWVLANGDSPVLTLPVSAYAPLASGRMSDSARIRLAVTGDVAGQTRATETLVAFAEGGEHGRDALDAAELVGLSPTRIQLFTLVDGHSLDVDVRPPLTDEPQDIAFDVDVVGATEATELTLSWPELSGLEGISLYIQDRQENRIVDLVADSEYAFSVAENQGRTASIGLRAPIPVRGGGDRARMDPEGRFVLFVGASSQPVVADPVADTTFELLPLVPNPARGRVSVQFSLDTAGPTRVTLHDMLGRVVDVLSDGPRASGIHEVVVRAGQLAPGVYIVRLATSEHTATQRVTVVR